ncbi:WD40 repeat domain-containing serine/threonine protein kinase [Nonomuraea typhae]|uniref:WD40 repeat domain-containing serine/threonine protein kinase n=1 Tax=Nonomuraea typhae TaxID=2603600 RepID=A0ABW7Z8F1_9ACTN
MNPLYPEDPRQIGPYLLQGRLGAGGMGEVFLGSSPSGRNVAVKVIRAEYAADPGFRARFAREIEAARKVGGFHTAQVVDAAPEAEAPWMVTAFIPGSSLREVVLRDGPLAPQATRALGAGLAEGLAAIHACGLVHRDLKPGNVIMAADGPRIIDFGIASSVEGTALTSAGAVVGTFSFMSPEQVRADSTGPASDVFSFGCVLVYAATGRGPFDAPTIPAIVHRIVNGPPTLDGLTGDLRDLVERCLAKDPRQRPPVHEVLALLTAAPHRVPRRGFLWGSAVIGLSAAAAVPAALLWSDDGPTRLKNAPNPPIYDTPTAFVLPRTANSIAHLVFSADGKFLLGAGSQEVFRWDLATLERTSRGFRNDEVAMGPMVFSPDARMLATGGTDHMVHLRDVASGRTVKTLPHAGEITCMAFSPDGVTLAISGSSASQVRLWNTVTGKVTTLSENSTASMMFSPAGNVLATGSVTERRLTLHDLSSGDSSPFTTEGGPPFSFSPDGRTVALSPGDSSIELRRTDNGWLRTSLTAHRAAVTGLGFSPDGDTLVTADDDWMYLWHVPSGRPTGVVGGNGGRPPKQPQTVVFAPDGRSFAVGSRFSVTTLWRFP